MKLRSILGCFIAASLVFATAPDMMAQKKSSSSRSPSTSSGLTKADVNGKDYVGYITLGTDMELFVRVSISDNDLSVIMQRGTEVGGSWSVSGNTLTSSSSNGNFKLTLTSKDKGKILEGTCLINGQKKSVKLYQCPSVSWDKATLKSAIEKDNFIAFVNAIDRDGMGVGAPVTFKYTKDLDNSNTGTFKVSGNSKILTELGALKGTLEFGDDSVKITGINGNQDILDYSDIDGAVYLNLGRKSGTTVQVVLIKK